MYQYHYQEGSSSILGEVASRPDVLLASGGALFLPLGHQQQEEISGSEMAMFRRAMSMGGGRGEEDEEEDTRVVVPPARYSAEERRERIDKYRSKRNQRNFQKKITYACRKTLADSRPRVKGRFARSGSELEAAETTTTTESPPVRNDVSTVPEWWPAMQEALASGVDLCDEEMLAAYLGVSSISLYSPSYSPSASS